MNICRYAIGCAPPLFFFLTLASTVKGDGASAANALFDEGKRLMAAGKYAQACPKFVDSQKLDPGVGTMLNLAVCYEKNGQSASAWSQYRDAAAAARDLGQKDREKTARAGAARLEHKVFKVVIGVSPQPNGKEIVLQLDGTAVPQGLWGLPVPIDPGPHRLEATSRNKRPWSTSFEVVSSSTPPVMVPVLEAVPVEAAPVKVVTQPAPARVPEPQAEPPPRDGSGQRVAAIIAGGLGVAGLGVGCTFGLMAKPTYDKSAPYCEGDVCTSEGHYYRERARTQGNIATAAFVVGGAGLVTAAVLWITAPKRPASDSALVITPYIADGAGMSVRGIF
jgi:serine/threonine-protein kinase